MAFNDGMMQYFAKLGLDASNFLSGIEKSQAGLLAFYRSSTIAMAGVTAAIYAVYSAQQKLGTLADEISDLSTTTGMSTEKIQQLQHAAVLSGDSFGTVATGINYLTLQMQKAGDESSEAAKAFQSLGVDISGQSPDQVFEDTTTALMSMEDETLRNSIAMSIYGRSWKEMLPYMEDYIKNREKIQSGPTLTEAELRDLAEAKAAWDDLGYATTIYTGTILSDLQGAYARAKNGADLWTAAQQLNIDKMREAIRVSGDLAAAEREHARQNWEKDNKDLLDKSGTGGTVWDMRPAQRIQDRKAALEKSVNPLEGKTSEQIEIEILSKYTIPDLQTAYEDLKISGTAAPKEIALAYADLISAQEDLAALTTTTADGFDTQTTAMERQKDAAENLKNEMDELADINKDYARDLQTLDPTDVKGFIDLRMRHQWDVEDQTANINTARAGQVSAFGEVGKAAMASAGITITGPITVNGDKSFEKMIEEQRIRAGVR
jgi:hypothetical protein